MSSFHVICNKYIASLCLLSLPPVPDVDGSPIPTEFCTSSSQCSTCRPGNHSLAAAIDGDPASGWQSSPLSARGQFGELHTGLGTGLYVYCSWSALLQFYSHCKNCVVNVTTNFSDVHYLNPSLSGSGDVHYNLW